MVNALVSTLERPTSGALAAISYPSGGETLVSAPPSEHVRPAVSIRFGSTYGNLPTVFSSPLVGNWLHGDIQFRALTAREQAVVYRAIVQTAKVIAKGRLSIL
jgi:16S rRNA A1518/A1519 N6-dimethyltransferase RsmA/KsgA/DIM1 with predicted DNA glycosylase/AP lyase activity